MSTTALEHRDDPYVGTDEVRRRFNVSPSARQRWQEHPNPTLRFPKGVKFTPGGRLLWKQSWLDAWEARVHEHARSQQFDPDELPVDWLPTSRELLEAEIAKLRDENAAQRAVIDAQGAEIAALRAELGIVIAENSALVARCDELCREPTLPEEVEDVEAPGGRKYRRMGAVVVE
jgi:hypothetical protein